MSYSISCMGSFLWRTMAKLVFRIFEHGFLVDVGNKHWCWVVVVMYLKVADPGKSLVKSETSVFPFFTLFFGGNGGLWIRGFEREIVSVGDEFRFRSMLIHLKLINES